MVGGYQPFLGWEDYDFWCRLAEHNLRGEWHPDVVALYRIHESSMLRTLTDVDANHRRLVEEFKARHPWVVLLAQEKFRHKPQPSLSLTDGDRRTRLHDLLPILRCPETGQKLVLTEDGASLMSVDGLRRWPIVEGRPVLFPDLAAPEVRPVEHLSNPLPDNALDLIRATRGLVLNLSAGGSTARFDHVVEAEFAIFRHTDVVADAHRLPFDDDVFEVVVVMNAFEAISSSTVEIHLGIGPERMPRLRALDQPHATPPRRACCPSRPARQARAQPAPRR